MTDKELLEMLAVAARQEARDPLEDPRWDQLSSEETCAADRRELEARAAGEGLKPEVVEAFQPLGSEAEGRFVEAIQRNLGRQAKQPGEARAADQDGEARAADQDGEAPAKPARVISLEHHRRRRRMVLACTAGLALAAAAALLLVWGPLRILGPEPLPEYELVLRGGAKLIRGHAQDQRIPVLEQDTLLELVLRPQTAVASPVQARIFAVRQGAGQLIEVQGQASANGSIRFRLVRGENLGLSPGRWELVLVVASPGDLPGPGTDPRSLVSRPGLVVLRQKVQVAQ